MLSFTIAFLIGDLFLQSLASLPAIYIFLIAMLTGVLSLFCKNKYTIVVAGLLLGFAYTGLQATQNLTWLLPHEWEGKPLIAHGFIHSLPVSDTYGTHFIFKVTRLQNQNLTINRPALIKLSMNGQHNLHPGDRYQLQVKLKQIHGLQNPGGFDYEAWSFHNYLRATGNVSEKAITHYEGHDYFYAPVEQVRQYLRGTIVEYLPDSVVSPWLLALMIGDRGSAPAEHWQILRATGTNHLMAIAGLHIGLIAGLLYAITQFIWRRSSRLLATYPAQLAASVVSLITAWMYSALAGFSIPTQRACIMLTFFLIARLLRRSLPPWHAWSGAMLSVLLINPLSVLSDSFWLSFATLALIIYGMHGRLSPKGWWWKWGRVQAVIGIGLIPFSFLFYRETSLVSVLANSIAIPWLAMLILPFCFFSMIFLVVYSPLGSLLLSIADFNLQYLWKVLEWFAHLPSATWSASIPSGWILCSTVMASLLFLLPRGMPGRLYTLIWILPLLLYQPERPQPSSFSVTVLDVGQGLSLVVQTHSHVLIYDTGPKFGAQFDMGESVVLPFLQLSRIKNIDMLIISHGDNDHIGGAKSVLTNLKVNSILTSVPDKLPDKRTELCLAGRQWQWDGVNFSILYPFESSLLFGNDSSCVLRVDNGKQSVLLTGDIEKFAENQLLLTTTESLHANILIAPHHGSKTSSQQRFIAAVDPQYVVYATGYLNRYHFPHSVVVDHYADQEILQLNTVDTGAITFKLKADNTTFSPESERFKHKDYWSL